MMQLPKPTQLPKMILDGMAMPSPDPVDMLEEMKKCLAALDFSVHDIAIADYNVPQTLLQSVAAQTTECNVSESVVLSCDVLGDEDKESALTMFRFEEEAFDIAESFAEPLLSASSSKDFQASPKPTSEHALSKQEDEATKGKSTTLAATPALPDNGDTGDSLEPERGFLPVLKNRNFLTLWSGQVFSQLADKVYLVLMIALIASRYQASENQTISGWVSSIMIACTIPAVLFGSIAGVYVDRWSKKWVLVATNLLRGGLVFALPFLFWVTKSWAPWYGLPVGFCILLAITFLISTLTQFFAPAEQSAMPLVVERRHLLSANSLYTTTMMAAVIIGFAIGEPVLAIADTIAAKLGWTAIGLGKEIVVGSSYVIAGLILMLLKIQEKNRAPVTNRSISHNGAISLEPETEYPHVFADIRDGVRYLSQQPRIRSAMIQLVILFSVFAALAVLSVRLAEVIPEIKSSQFGFLLAAGGVGMGIGAAFVGQFGQRFFHTQLSLYGSLGMAASLVGLSLFAQQLIPALLLITCLGGFAAIVGVPMQTTIQEETPEEMRGKVFGLQNNAINIALSLPLALAGIAETFFGVRPVFLGLAGLMIAGGLLTWYISRTGLTKR
jgi:predicted MFS family arabinose efflux permease